LKYLILKIIYKIKAFKFIILTLLIFLFIAVALLIFLFNKASIPNYKNNLNKYYTNSNNHEQKDTSFLNIEDRLNKSYKDQLKNDVLNILQDRKDNYAIYIKVINEDFEIGLNENELFYPASIYKVPIAILILRDIENKKYSLDTALEITDEHKFYKTDTLYYYENGTFLSVKTLLEFMICYSDNTAWDMLQDNLLGDSKTIDLRMKEELDLTYTKRVPFQTTAYEISLIFENLYNNKYLNKKSSDYLINLLSNIVQSQNDRIPKGVPKDTKVAHKIGNWIGIYQDAGIIYGENLDYILVVLNKNSSVNDSKLIIQNISKTVWDYIN
jgi:beta-lactamase class A